MKKKPGSKRTIFIVTTVAAVVVVVFALVRFTTDNRKRITAENREYLVDNATQMAQSIDSALTDGYANIKMLSNMVSDSLEAPEFDVANIQKYIRDSVFDFIEFADTDGMDHNITGGVSDARDRQYYLDARDGNSGMELIYVSRATHETLLMFYSPITYRGEFAGSLVGVYQAANRITKLLSSQYFGKTATAYLAAENGRIIASNQGFDPQNEMYVEDLAGGDAALEAELNAALDSSETKVFSMPGNETGGCVVKLPDNGGYLIQIFPPEASEDMIRSANAIGYELVIILVLLYLAVLTALIVFYHNQQKQLQEAYDEAKDARVAADAANQAKTNFLFNMSHDIRTPMNAIRGFTTMAKKNAGDKEKVTAYLDKIDISGQQLLTLINQVLEMARIESGTVEFEENPVNVQEEFNSMVTVLAEQANTSGINFSHFLKNVKHSHVFADEARMSSITLNIIGNALKYTPEGGSVIFELEEVQSRKAGYATYVFTVSDTGIGMSEEYLKELYTPFSRAKNSTVSKIQGTGLGLSIVKNLVDIMGGTINVQSELGKGTRFDITVDFKINENAENSAEEADDAAAHISFGGRRVLLVEDNEMNREIAKDILEERGLIVEYAEDGDIAVAMVQAVAEQGKFHYYDFILMDIQMPRMNGYEATKEIRAIPGPEGVHIPIIAMTANAFEEDRQNALAAGMDEHLAKPIDVQKAFRTIAKFLK